MFDEVTKKEGGKNAARRAGFIFGSTIFQASLVAAIVAASAYVKAKVIDEPKVDVKFVKTAPPPRPPPPPAPPAPKRPKSDKPKTDLPKPPPPQALIQPQDVQAEMKTPDPSEKEPEYDWGDEGGEGVVGGVASAGGGIEDAPQFAMAGFRKPVMAQKNCVQEAVRIPRELQGFISGPITVKFAVGRDSSPSRFEVITNGVPDRISASIWSAVQECKWIAGADAQGRPTAIWVILPLRFTQG